MHAIVGWRAVKPDLKTFQQHMLERYHGTGMELGMTHDYRLIYKHEYNNVSSLHQSYRQCVGTTFNDHQQRLRDYLCMQVDEVAKMILTPEAIKAHKSKLVGTALNGINVGSFVNHLFYSIDDKGGPKQTEEEIKLLEREVQRLKDNEIQLLKRAGELSVEVQRLQDHERELIEVIRQKDQEITTLKQEAFSKISPVSEQKLTELLSVYRCDVCSSLDTPKLCAPCSHILCEECTDRIKKPHGTLPDTEIVQCPTCRSENDRIHYRKVAITTPRVLRDLAKKLE